jgi:regulatory helix-turn-helix LysR family protein
MELRDIRYFLVLCEELHFTRAADRCGVSQPCISAAVRKIEAELGGTLIHRKPQPQLTELGQAMRPLWIDALRKVEDSVALALARAPSASPPLQPAAPATLDEVREAMERIIAAENVDSPPLSPSAEDSDGADVAAEGEGGEHRSAVVLARLRDQRIVASCRARNGWTPTRTLARHHGALQPTPPKRGRRLAVAAVAMMLVAAAGFALATLPAGKLFGDVGHTIEAASPGASTSGASSER